MPETTGSGDRLSERVRGLDRDLTTGQWAPAPLECRVAEILVIASAGDGELTDLRIRAAFREGAEAFVRENGGRLAALLADLIPAVNDPAPEYRAAVTEAQDLLVRIAVRTTGRV